MAAPTPDDIRFVQQVVEQEIGRDLAVFFSNRRAAVASHEYAFCVEPISVVHDRWPTLDATVHVPGLSLQTFQIGGHHFRHEVAERRLRRPAEL